MSFQRLLIMAPMTCGKTSFLEAVGLPPFVFIDGDFPFTLDPGFKEAWAKRHRLETAPPMPEPWGAEPWPMKDRLVMQVIRPYAFVTHQNIPLCRDAIADGIKVVGFLPVSSPQALMQRWKDQRPEWVTAESRKTQTGVESTDSAFNDMLKMQSLGLYLLRSFEDIDSFGEEVKRRGKDLPRAEFERGKLVMWTLKNWAQQMTAAATLTEI